MSPEELMSALAGDPMERLRWYVLRSFSRLPGDRAARKMSDSDYLRCAAHMAMDRIWRGGRGIKTPPSTRKNSKSWEAADEKRL